MPVSAFEVRTRQFDRAPIGTRGYYDPAAVDAFLHDVEGTLAGLSRSSGYYIAPALEHTHTRKPLWRRR